MMRLADLQSRGGFVSGGAQKRAVEWTHIDDETGKLVTDKFDVFVIQPSYGMIDTAFRESKEQITSAQAAAIAACIRLGENAEEKMTYDQAFSLHPALAMALIEAINSAGVVPKKPSPSSRTKRSGTS